MLDPRHALLSYACLCALAVAGWLWSLHKRDVSIVDPIWPLFFLTGTAVYGLAGHLEGARALLVYLCVGIWSLRLSVHLIARSRGEPEDRRYQAIRARNEPGFQWKSLYLVFVLQATLAAIIGVPLLSAAGGRTPLNLLDALGCLAWLCGFLLEVIADLQLVRFKHDPASRGRVLDHGLWSWSRHPNYFGEALLWWGFYCFALAAGAPWSVFAPILMTFLLLKVSGVALLEQDIHSRRPGYKEYVSRTSAFVPWPPRKSAGAGARVVAFAGTLLLIAPLLALVGCRGGSEQPPLESVSSLDLPRFMGRWYVIASIPTRLERGAHNAVESYVLNPDGTIQTTFTFRDGAFDGPEKTYHPKGFVRDPGSRAVWGMQFVWPIKADYRVIYLTPDYQQTVIARSARDHVWLMARSPQVNPSDYERMLAEVRQAGYDVNKLQAVPQRWPVTPQP